MATELSSRPFIPEIDQQLSARVQALKQHDEGVLPHLHLVTDNSGHKPTQDYMGIKGRVAHKLGMNFSHNPIPWSVYSTRNMFRDIDTNASNPSVDGVVVQLPLVRPEETDGLVATIPPHKDVDGLSHNALYRSATSTAILRLMDLHDIDYQSSQITVLGKGRLVGHPLTLSLKELGCAVEVFDEHSDRLEMIKGMDEADIIISAMGLAYSIEPYLFGKTIAKPRVLIDAGSSEQGGVSHGDVSSEMRAAALVNGWSVTPEKGGVGPLTVRTLLDNVIDAAERRAGFKEPHPGANYDRPEVAKTSRSLLELSMGPWTIPPEMDDRDANPYYQPLEHIGEAI